MKLSELKDILNRLEQVSFQLENGMPLPAHLHVTELGILSRHFIDCGGTIREAQKINLQLWYADDYDHRLLPAKLLYIIRLSEERLPLADLDIEVEFQSDTIGKYGLDYNGRHFVLTNTTTACLASDACAVPEPKLRVNLSALGTKPADTCAPGSNCCS